ncbi:DUF294 nucleotidyltransferase-like domain-containing protein [Pelodictyon luteolum]|uniref:Cyclic nucleotide-binding domain (CNMP-BD) protein n=1 Tax=Chlorobium luteolum (strain DSM 273 / BCRC 81028 / 2530) TaxID=319225 RepID=Q3B460_CHLL3|nr:DUF294 nucleotidyltransferase-like domain-containing protein [Pelodictyon luteolum]ABB23871.1 cyclic nucleotide-binding domain (cNMP-BD) protein [Pelodictyon luteolum DSM 273]
MPSNTIVERVAADLSKYPPFDKLAPEVLGELASAVSVSYHEEGELLFKKDDPLKGAAFMVMKGAVKLYDRIDGEEVLVDLYDEGDVFGVRAIFGGHGYLLYAQVAEESLIYDIPVGKIKELIAADAGVSMFFAGEFAKSVQEIERTLSSAFSLRRQGAPGPSCSSFLEHETLEVKPVVNVVTCPEDISVREAAVIMAECNIGSILVVSPEGHPRGIITDTDLRKKVVAVSGPVNERPVRDIMSSPVYTITGGKTVADMVMLMVKTKLRHFCITLDGTIDTPVRGIISEHDIITSEGNNPAVIMKEIMAAEGVEQFKAERDKAENLLGTYMSQNVAVHFMTSIITEINDAIITRAIRTTIAALQAEGRPLPSVPFSWLSLGSEGRKEQLLRTDQDNALLYADPEESERESVREFFLELARRVTGMLEGAGFVRCPAEVMASNPKWCLPLTEWKSCFRRWIETPEPKAVMHSTIFFDFRPVYGDGALAGELKRDVFESIARGRGFLEFFAKNALQNPPPLGFFRNFMVEKSRDHANEFDIKSRAMMPLADAARVLSYQLRIPEYFSTVERFRRIGELEPALSGLCLEAAAAYEFLMKLRALNGLEHSSSGRYIKPESLNKLDRQMLRNVFTTIGEIQQTLNLRFQLDYIRD